MPKFARPTQHNGRQATQQWTGDSRFATLEEALAGVSTTTAISPATMQVGTLNTLSVQGGAPIVPAAGNFNFTGATGQIVFSSTGPGQIVATLANTVTSTIGTPGAVPTVLILINLPAVAAVYTYDISVAGFASAGPGTPLGCGYTIVGSVRSTGVASFLIQNQAKDEFEEGVLSAANCELIVNSGANQVIVQVTGVASTTITWKGILSFVVSP